MNNHLQGILSKGYVLFPKALFEEQMILNQQAKGHSCISPWQYNHVIQRS